MFVYARSTARLFLMYLKLTGFYDLFLDTGPFLYMWFGSIEVYVQRQTNQTAAYTFQTVYISRTISFDLTQS